MKRQNLLRNSLTLLLLLIAVPMLFSQFRGNGNVEKQKRYVGDFSAIFVRSGIDLYVTQGDQPEVMIETDENLQEYVLAEVESGILYVYVKKNTRITRSSAMDAHVTVDQLDRLKVSGGGDVHSKNLISTGDIKMSVSGGGDLEFDLKANRAVCEVSGGGDVSLDADIGELKAAISGGGDLEFEGDLGLLELNMSGGGDASLEGGRRAEGILADMSGGGDLIMKMPCEKIKVSSTGGGDVSARPGSDVTEASFSLLGGGDLSMEIHAADLAISLGGGGDASLTGSVNKFACEIKSGGNLAASDFRIQAAKIDLSGGGDARIAVEKELILKASGGSHVHLSGDPHVDASLTGGSKLHRR